MYVCVPAPYFKICILSAIGTLVQSPLMGRRSKTGIGINFLKIAANPLSQVVGGRGEKVWGVCF